MDGDQLAAPELRVSRLAQPLAVRMAAHGACDVELVLRVKNEEDTLARRLWRAMAQMRAQGLDGGILVVDCGSVDHSVDVALVTDAEVPVSVISHSDATPRGWVAAAIESCTARAMAFACESGEAESLAAACALLADRSLVVATIHQAAAPTVPPAGRGIARGTTRWSPPGGPDRAQLVVLATETAKELVDRGQRIHQPTDLIPLALGAGMTVRELRTHEVGEHAGIPRWSWLAKRPQRPRISLG